MAVIHYIDPCGCACGGQKVAALAAFQAWYLGWTEIRSNIRADAVGLNICYHGEALHNSWTKPKDCSYGMAIPQIYCKKTVRHEWHWVWWEFGGGVGSPQEWDYSIEETREQIWLNGALSISSTTTGEQPPEGLFSELCPGSEDLVDVIEDSGDRVEWTEYGESMPGAVPFGTIFYRCIVTLENPHTWADFETACQELYDSLDLSEMVSELRSHGQPCIHVYHDEDGVIQRHVAASWTEEPPSTASFTAFGDGFYYSTAHFEDDLPVKVSKFFWAQNRYCITGFLLDGFISGRFRGTKIAAPISVIDDPDVQVDPWNVYLPPGWVPIIPLPGWPPPIVSYGEPIVQGWQKVPTYWDVVRGATLYVSECNWDKCRDIKVGLSESTIEVPADEYLGIEADPNHVIMVREDMHHDDCGTFTAF